MHVSKLNWHALFIATLLLLLQPVAHAADASGTRQQELPSKKRIEREKTFLLRSSDDVGRSLADVGETIALLSEEVASAKSREPGNRAKERLDLLEWYQKYGDWLGGMAAEFDLDVSDYFSRQRSGPGWTNRYDELAKSSRKLAGELDGMLQKLAGEKGKVEARMKKLRAAVTERRILVDKDDLELARELWPTYRTYDRREAIYKDLSETEVVYFRNEMRTLEEPQKYFESLAELEAGEEDWLNSRADEFAKLHELARAVAGDDAGELAAAVRGTVRTYESNMAAFKRRSQEIDAKLHAMTRSGTFSMLERLDELSKYLENMRDRYDRHREWLGTQIGSYQADLVELSREL